MQPARRHPVASFVNDFAWAVQAFQERVRSGNENFARGTALHFHARLIERVRKNGGFPSRWITDDEQFVEWLYAMLAAWGMDSQAAKVVPFPRFRTAIRAIARSAAFKKLESSTLSTIDSSWNDRMLGLWQVLTTDGKIMASQSVTVAASKVLHHLLPDLFAPIDRRYTLAFLCHLERSEPYRITTTEAESPGADSFIKAMMFYGHVARTVPNLEGYLGRGPMTGSIPKVIDNAVMMWWAVD